MGGGVMSGFKKLGEINYKFTTDTDKHGFSKIQLSFSSDFLEMGITNPDCLFLVLANRLKFGELGLLPACPPCDDGETTRLLTARRQMNGMLVALHRSSCCCHATLQRTLLTGTPN